MTGVGTNKIEHVLVNCECRHAQTGYEALSQLRALIEDLDNLRRLVRMSIDEDQHECRGQCPDDDMPDVRDPDCLACALIDFPEAAA